MYINPTLLLLLALTFVFSPAIQEWVLTGGAVWYRPYLIWIAMIVFIYWSQRGKSGNEF
jgi:EamA domain-containing membrane protein RarD